jgi:hypothetical protein
MLVFMGWTNTLQSIVVVIWMLHIQTVTLNGGMTWI